MQEQAIAQTGNAAAASARVPAGSSPRILVVDDDVTILRLGTRVLLQAGYRVDAAGEGETAWGMLQVNGYDLLVTDHVMPGLSGLELLRKVHEARLALPAIMASGTLPWDEFIRCPWLQPAATLQKPFSFAELLGVTRMVLCGAADDREQPALRPDRWAHQAAGRWRSR